MKPPLLSGLKLRPLPGVCTADCLVNSDLLRNYIKIIEMWSTVSVCAFIHPLSKQEEPTM